MNDRDIVTRFFARDESAITALDEKYGKSLNSLSYRITSDSGTAEECVNDTYMKTWETVPPKNPCEYLFAFVAKICRRLSLDRVRGQSRKKRSSELTVICDELAEIPVGDTNDGELFRAELAAIIGEFVGALPRAQRDVFLERYFYMKPVKETARTLGFTEGKVKSILLRTREKLKLHLLERGYTV